MERRRSPGGGTPTRRSTWGALALVAAFAGCPCAASSQRAAGAAQGPRGPATEVQGAIPAALPSRLLIGLVERHGETWMKESGVRWDVRYAYFTKGWIDGWGSGAADGAWGLRYLRECAAQGFIPAVSYYQVFGEPGGGEQAFLEKVQSPETMRSYFSDVAVLMRRAREFGGPVLVLVEPDGFGYLQQKSGGDPTLKAAVASTRIPALQGLPDTVAGWGLAFLRLRQAERADNVILGMHVSAWASGRDVAHTAVDVDLEPEVAKTYAFLAPLGLAANATGSTYDVLVADPLDRDARFYELTQHSDRWWDARDDAPVRSRSFNRYLEWLRLWNATARKRWVIWQIPAGNSNHLDVLNRGLARQGYKDNRPEYFFGPRAIEHLERFARAGAIALLFGAGMDGMSSHRNDVYFDGQPFLQSRVGALLRAGPLVLPRGQGPVHLRTPLQR